LIDLDAFADVGAAEDILVAGYIAVVRHIGASAHSLAEFDQNRRFAASREGEDIW
jgi:hypothetical protein